MSALHQEQDLPVWEVLAWTLGDAIDEPSGIALVIQTRQGPMALELSRQQATDIAEALRERVRPIS